MTKDLIENSTGALNYDDAYREKSDRKNLEKKFFLAEASFMTVDLRTTRLFGSNYNNNTLQVTLQKQWNLIFLSLSISAIFQLSRTRKDFTLKSFQVRKGTSGDKKVK